jgi:hypothetical protein
MAALLVLSYPVCPLYPVLSRVSSWSRLFSCPGHSSLHSLSCLNLSVLLILFIPILLPRPVNSYQSCIIASSLINSNCFAGQLGTSSHNPVTGSNLTGGNVLLNLGNLMNFVRKIMSNRVCLSLSSCQRHVLLIPATPVCHV